MHLSFGSEGLPVEGMGNGIVEHLDPRLHLWWRRRVGQVWGDRSGGGTGVDAGRERGVSWLPTLSALGLQQQRPDWRHHLQTEAPLCVSHGGLLREIT